jgi:hypothetical protein
MLDLSAETASLQAEFSFVLKGLYLLHYTACVLSAPAGLRLKGIVAKGHKRVWSHVFKKSSTCSRKAVHQYMTA